MSVVDLDELVAAARALLVPGDRAILGVTGAPGSGKSTLARKLADALGPQAVVVGLDGFHLADSELHRLGRHARKGAADTFDAAGYVHLLRRLRERSDPVVYAPMFDRGLEAALAGFVPVPSSVPLIITEGNYLLVDDPVWGQVRGLLDATWYLDPGEDVRLRRLIDRHVSYGRSLHEAEERSHGSDQRNADVIAATQVRADRTVQLSATTPPLEALA